MESKTCCRVANAFLSRLELIWPITRLKMSKKCIFSKKLQESNGFKIAETAMRTSSNTRLDEQNNGNARAL